jgi:hypothetical protein
MPGKNSTTPSKLHDIEDARAVAEKTPGDAATDTTKTQAWYIVSGIGLETQEEAR